MGLQERIAWGTPLEAGGEAGGQAPEGGIWLGHPVIGQISDIVVSPALFSGAFAVIVRSCATGILDFLN
jgi:hypothetical protein